jgi:hypothetical protein
MTHRGLADPHDQREVAHAQLISQAQSVKDARACSVREQSEGVGQALSLARAQQFADEGRDLFGVQALRLASIKR